MARSGRFRPRGRLVRSDYAHRQVGIACGASGEPLKCGPMTAPPERSAPGPRSKRIRGGWALEAAGMVLALYPVYGWIRDLVGVSRADAFHNANQIIGWQERLGFDHERTIQGSFLSSRWFIGFWNLFYGSIHFAGPVVTLVALYHFDPGRYVRWRNTLLLMFGLGLLCFWAIPLMPPRLMPPRLGFVDTAAKYFNFGPQQRVRFGPDGNPDPASVKC